MMPQANVGNGAAQRWIRLGFMLTWTMGILIFSPGGEQAAIAQSPAKPVTIDSILEVYKKRQERTKTARFIWREQRTQVRGSLSEMFRRLPEGSLSKQVMAKTIPSVDTTHEFACRLDLDGESVCYHTEGKVYCPTEDTEVLQTYTSAFHKGVGKILNKWNSTRFSWPQGSIRSESEFVDRGVHGVRAFTLLYRGRSRDLRPFDLSQYTLAGPGVKIDDVPCVELQQQRSGGRVVFRVWLAPERDFVPVRMSHSTGDKITFQLTVRYKDDTKHGWVPHTWQAVYHGPDGRLRSSVDAQLLRYDFDKPIRNPTFDLTFPPGTSVSDQRSGKSYVIKPSGEKRSVLPTEYRVPYAELINSDPAPRAVTQTTARFWFRFTLCSIIVMAGTLYLYRRLVRSKSASPPHSS